MHKRHGTVQTYETWAPAKSTIIKLIVRITPKIYTMIFEFDFLSRFMSLFVINLWNALFLYTAVQSFTTLEGVSKVIVRFVYSFVRPI